MQPGQEGEICTSGRHRFIGYFKDDEATRKTIDQNGLVHSGDLGHLDNEGFLYITGRIKELIVTSGGENIPFLMIEEALKQACPILSNVVIIGDQRRFIAGLFTLKCCVVDLTPTNRLTDNVINELKQVGVSASTVEEVLNEAKVRKYVQMAVDEVNKKCTSNAQTIRKWKILPSDFSIAGGELTPTLKLKRKVIEAKYARELEEFYNEPKL